MLRRLRKPRPREPPDLQHLTAARHDVISERMLSLSPRSQAQREEDQEAALREIGDDYLEETFDAVAAELARLPPSFDANMLDALVDRRSWVLEKVNEKLSGNVLRNWDRFVDGLHDVTIIQGDIEGAYLTIKDVRSELAWQAAEASAGLAIAAAWHRRAGLAAMQRLVGGLAAANAARASIMEAQADGEYAEALARCGAAAAALDAVQGLAVADALAASVDELAADTAVQLASALQAVCTDFHGPHFMRVLEGYHALGSGAALGPEVGATFIAATTAATLKVVRGVVLARRGLEVPGRRITSLQEAVRLLPSDAFRSCLSRVLMVLWDVMAAHHRMRAWLAAQLAATGRRIATLDEVVKERQRGDELAADAGPGTPPPVEVRLSRAAGGERRPFGMCDDSGGGEPAEAEDAAQTGAAPSGAGGAAESAVRGPGGAANAAWQPAGPHLLHAADAVATAASAVAGSPNEAGQTGTEPRSGPDSEADSEAGSDIGGDAHSTAGSAASGSSVSLAAGTSPDAATAMPALLRYGADGDPQAQLAAQEAWAATLESLRGGLAAGREALWEDVVQRVGVLLSAPAAFSGEHFVQVMEWTQTILQAGEVFTGGPAEGLRASLQRASGRFFPAHHSANVSLLVSLLDAELWTPLPVPAQQLPSMPRAFAAAGSAAAPPAGAADFAQWVAAGNPWRAHTGAPAVQHQSPTAGSGSSSSSDSMAVGGLAAQGGPADGSSAPSPQRQDAGVAGDVVVTNASLKLLAWLADYAALTRVLAADVREVYSSICQLFELFLLAVFRSFSDVPLGDIVGETPTGGASQPPQPQQPDQAAALDAVPRRLHAVLNRIANRSLAPYRAIILPPPSPMAAAGAGSGADSGSRSASGVLGSGGSAGNLAALPGGPGAESAAATRQQRRGAGGSILWHSGNMYGMQERKVAVDALATVAAQFSAAAPQLRRLAGDAAGVPDSHAPDAFFQTVAAADDVRDHIWRTGARANLPTAWLPARISGGSFAVLEPPSAASPWVAQLLQQARAFGQKLDAAPRLQPADRQQLWRHALAAIAEGVLAGFAGVTGRCTPMGRASMSLDLQQLTNGLAELLPPGVSAADALRIVDTYVKAFYIPWGADLQRWAATHPEYTKAQLASLIALVADSQGLKRKDRASALAAIDAELTE